MGDNTENKQKDFVESFQSLFKKEEVLAKVIDCFPHPIQVYAPDGTSILVNKAMLAEYHNISSDMVVGKYNIFTDPYIVASGHLHKLKRAFRGETVFFTNIKVPLEDIVKRYGVKPPDVEAIYQDITVFPIFDDMKNVIFVAALMINKRVYRGKNEIEKAKEYMETHWLDKFDADKIAKAVNLSRAHFTKLFKKHTGMTPHQYYINYKIGKVKEKLLDTNLTVAQAFAACNMDYNGHSAKVFKDKTGVSPSAYREMAR